jgi:acetyl-CoA/propionyl-CoA carboxylase biotin carboxyl carrier protein
MKYHVTIEGREFVVFTERDRASSAAEEVQLEHGSRSGMAVFLHHGRRFRLVPQSATRDGLRVLYFDGKLLEARVESDRDRLRARRQPARGGGPATLTSAIPGVIRQVLLGPGDPVAPGTAILTLEAMKMENEIRAGIHGRVKVLHVRVGQIVNAGEPLATLEEV